MCLIVCLESINVKKKLLMRSLLARYVPNVAKEQYRLGYNDIREYRLRSMNIDDRPTSHCGKFQMAITCSAYDPLWQIQMIWWWWWQSYMGAVPGPKWTLVSLLINRIWYIYIFYIACRCYLLYAVGNKLLKCECASFVVSCYRHRSFYQRSFKVVTLLACLCGLSITHDTIGYGCCHRL